MNKKVFIKLFCVLILGISVQACTKPKVQLNGNHRKMIDTLYLKQRKILLVELDSLCALDFDQKVALAKDSIMDKRIKEIEALIDRSE